MNRRKILEWGGVAAGVVLIAFGIGTLVLSIAGHNEVRSQLEREAIVGSPDMTPDEIAKGAQEAGLPDSIELPTCSVAGEEIDTGSEAKCFADYMRIHALESTGGLSYAEMGQSSRPPTRATRPGRTIGRGGAEGRRRKPGLERRPQHLGDGDLALNRAQHVVSRGEHRALRNRRRDSAHSRGYRVHHPRAGRGAPAKPSGRVTRDQRSPTRRNASATSP